MKVIWNLTLVDENQELSPSELEHTVFDERISNIILDFFDDVKWDVELVVTQWRITIRQIESV